MTGRKTQLPPGTEIKDGKIVLPGPKPRDAAQARSWAKGGRKNKHRPLKKGVAALYNSIGKTKS